MKKITTTLAAAALAIGLLAGCSSGTIATPAPAPAPAAPADPAPAEPPAVTDTMQLAMIQTYREKYADGASDQQIIAMAIEVCSAFQLELDAGGSFTSFVMDGSMTSDDPERFGYMLGLSLLGQCPELTEHPNYSVGE